MQKIQIGKMNTGKLIVVTLEKYKDTLEAYQNFANDLLSRMRKFKWKKQKF